MLRITLAVAAGFLTMMVLVIATQVAMLRYLFHTDRGIDVDLLPPAYYLAYAVVRVVYAVMGGWNCNDNGNGDRQSGDESQWRAPVVRGSSATGGGAGGDGRGIPVAGADRGRGRKVGVGKLASTT